MEKKQYKQVVFHQIGDRVERDDVVYFAAKPYIKSTCDRCCFYDKHNDTCKSDGSIVTNCYTKYTNYIIKRVVK